MRLASSKPATNSNFQKRSSPPPPSVTSPKRQKLSQLPHPATLDPYDSPRSVHRTPTLHRTAIGPTPQKDGRVLGLFDLLSPEVRNGDTPSERKSLGVVSINSIATPSRKAAGTVVPGAVEGQDDKPSSTAPRNVRQEPFLTPSCKRIAEQRTPGSRGGVSKLRFDVTPAFLRRNSQQARLDPQNRENTTTGNIEEVSWSPVAMRRQPKPLGRSLSTLVKGLRALEDEKLDEELELMREMEQETIPDGDNSRPSVKESTVAVENSQLADMPLGPDKFGSSEDDDEDIPEEERGRDGKPRKVWKKKGQKRTTRRSNMRPNTSKWKPEPEWKGPAEPDEEHGVVLVKETQLHEQAAPHIPADNDDLEYLTEDDSGYSGKQGKVELSTKSSKKPKEQSNGNRGGEDIRTAPTKKKISPTAHANFRALKIKNKHSKAKGGGRFGRRR